MRTGRWLVAAAAFLGIVPASVRAAETAASDLAVEYSFNRITNGDGLDMPLGLAVAFAANVSRRFGVVADVRWSHKSEADASLDLTSFQAGPRLTLLSQSATVYVQGVAGATRASGAGSSVTKLSLMPGVGADLKLTHTLAFRLGADLRAIFVEGENEKDLLVHAGLVWRWGGR